MKKSFMNSNKIEGYLYEAKLNKKVSGENSKAPGTTFINGEISIATNEDCTNIIPIHFSYVTAVTSTGKTNPCFNILSSIVDGAYKSIMTDGKENAVKLALNASIEVNDFYTERNGTEELVSSKRNEGGFLTSVVNELNQNEDLRCRFDVDMIINNVSHKDGDEERGYPDKAILKGYIFNFQKAILPIELTVIDPAAINYFENYGISDKEPLFTELRGYQVSTTVIERKEEESAFGGKSIIEVPHSRKEYVVDWAKSEPYLWDDESTIEVKDIQEMQAARETYLATVKQRNDEYKASKKNAGNAIPTATATASKSQFNF